MISRKGGAGWAVGATIAETVHAIGADGSCFGVLASDRCYGLKDVCLSVPTVVGRGGAEKHIELKLWPKEEQGLKASAKALQTMLSKVGS